MTRLTKKTYDPVSKNTNIVNVDIHKIQVEDNIVNTCIWDFGNMSDSQDQVVKCLNHTFFFIFLKRVDKNTMLWLFRKEREKKRKWNEEGFIDSFFLGGGAVERIMMLQALC